MAVSMDILPDTPGLDRPRYAVIELATCSGIIHAYQIPTS